MKSQLPLVPKASRKFSALLFALILLEIEQVLAYVYPVDRLVAFEDPNWGLCDHSYFLRFSFAAISISKLSIMFFTLSHSSSPSKKTENVLGSFKSTVFASFILKFLCFSMSVYPFCMFFFKPEDIAERLLYPIDSSLALCVNLILSALREVLILGVLVRVLERKAPQKHEQIVCTDASLNYLNI